MAKQKVDTYIFQPGIPLKDNRYPNAYELIQNNVEFICDEVVPNVTAPVTVRSLSAEPRLSALF